MEMRPVSIEDIVKYNPLFDRYTWFSEDRDKFFEAFEKDEDGTIEKWTKPYAAYNETLKVRIFNSLPTAIRRIAVKVLK